LPRQVVELAGQERVHVRLVRPRRVELKLVLGRQRGRQFVGRAVRAVARRLGSWGGGGIRSWLGFWASFIICRRG
jgi:hypothetical protein